MEHISKITKRVLEGIASPIKCEREHVQPYTWWEVDARGIPLCKVCDDCVDERLAKYRPDVITDPNYWADEPIEPEEY